MSPHVVPKASLGHAADEEKTAVDSSWEDEQSTIDQAEMAEKVRRALLDKRRAATGNTTATTGQTIDEPTVEERHRVSALELATIGVGRLVVEAGPDTGKEFPLKPGQVVTVGRAIDNNVVLTDLSVSRKHFELRWDGVQWMLADRGSGNGTLLNGKVEDGAFPLTTGDQIEIGHTVFRFEQFGQARRAGWGEEEPSTIAGRRASGSGSRPSAIQTSEFAAPSPQDSIPLPLERKRGLPPPRGHSSIGAPYAPPPPSQPYAPAFAAPSFPSFQGGEPEELAELAELAGLASSGLASQAGNRPMATLRGRPPIVGPTAAPPQPHDGLVPPRPVAIPLEMVPMMQTAPQPRQPLSPPRSQPHAAPMAQLQQVPMARPQLGAVHQHSMQQRMAHNASHPMMGPDSGISVSATRFPQVSRRSSIYDAVPKLTRRTKTTMALVAGGLVLLVAVVALAMGASNELAPVAPPPTQPPSVVPIGTTPPRSSEQLAAEKAAAEQAAGERLAVEKAAAEQAVAERLAVEKAAAEQATAEQLAATKAAAELAAAELAAAEKLTAEKATAEKLAAEKAAAEKLAAEKAAAEKLTARPPPKRAPEKAAKVSKVEKTAKEPIKRDKPRSDESDAALLDKADDLYRRKNFAGAAALLRDAMKGRSNTEELRAAAQIYEALQRTYSAGTASGAKSTDAYINLRSAARYDDKLGKAHAADIGPRITAMAPRAAAQFVALKQYDDAFQALRDAERGGSSNSTLQAVRAAIDAHASDLYNQAQTKREDDPASARALYRRVLKLVDSGSSLHQRATKALSDS